MDLVLNNIKIYNYKSINEVSLDVNKYSNSYTTIFVGRNETGKSNLLDAIGFIDEPKSQFVFENIKNAQNEDSEYIDFYYTFVFNDTYDSKEVLKTNIKTTTDIIDKINITGLEKNIYLEKNSTTLKNSNQILYSSLSDSLLSKYSFKKIEQQAAPNETYKYEIVLSKTINVQSAESYENNLYQTLSNEKLVEILDDIFKITINKNKLTVSKWKYSNEYLITEVVDLNQFKEDNNICYPLKNIFRLAGYSTPDSIKEKINSLIGSPKNINKLETNLEKVSTEYINKIWAESKIHFKFKIQDDLKLSAYVIDDADDENTYYMSDRSEGFKQFVSLILSISAANETDSLKNNIIIIDEPEVHMHPSGIRYMKNELLRIGENNYVFIATHSQFMIDKDNKERHYIVTKPNNNTCVNKWNSNRDLSDDEILRQAFGINVLNDLLAKNKLLVEGYTECQILSKAISVLYPNNCISITNGIGSNIVAIASMLKMYNVPVLTIVDADKIGEKYKQDIIKLGSPFDENSVKTIRDFNDEIISYGTIEDTLDNDFVIKHLTKAYKEKLNKGECAFKYDNTKAIIESFKIYLNQEKVSKNIADEIIENAKTSIGDNFKPNKTNLNNKNKKLLEIVQKINDFFVNNP